MSRTIFVALSLVFAGYFANLAYDGLGLNDSAQVSVVASQESRPGVKLQWVGPGAKNQVTFTPAPAFLVLLGIAGPMALGGMTLNYMRTS